MRALLVVAWLAAAAPAQAQAQPRATLYDDLGGHAGLSRIIGAMVDRAAADPRIADKFDNANLTRLKRIIVQHVCSVTDGGCSYTRGLRGSHVQLELTRLHFNALVEVLQDVMDEQGVAFRTQNRLLARLAPMQREIVTK
jgi:hemoglobin